MKERCVVRDARAASAFSSARSRGLLLELVTRELSLQELAATADISLSLAQYYVGRLCDRGLVEVTRVLPRRGRGVKHYRACARSFFIPSAWVSDAPGKELAAELRAALDQARRNAPDDGVLIFVDDQGSPRMRRTQSIAKISVAMATWFRLALSDEQARALVGELKAVMSRFEDLRPHKGKTFIAHCALAPLQERR